MDDDLFGRIFSVAGAAWAATAMLAVRLFHTWPLVMDRLNERKRDSASEKAEDWKRLRDERDHALDLLTKCQHERVEWMRRAITAEATLQGYGSALQQAQVIVSAERLTEKKPGEA